MLHIAELDDFFATEVYNNIKRKDLIFTVTSGRSGTKLLTALLAQSLKIPAEHEPEPRANFFLRSAVERPNEAMRWLITTKLPYIVEHTEGALYAEMSHIYCKGFIELFSLLRLHTKFIILRRNSREVASSLFRMSAVPERTAAGKLVLLGPSDPGVWKLPEWQKYSDYQLCYWYAREIERRQEYYAADFESRNIPFFEIQMHELLQWDSFLKLCEFIDPLKLHTPMREEFEAVVAKNQNPRHVAHPGSRDISLPTNIDEQEFQLDYALSATTSSTSPTLTANLF